jgi:hypothetical protein
MYPDRPTLTRALLKGSLWHFLAAFAIPVLLIGGGISLRLVRNTGTFRGEEVLIVVAFFSIVLGAIFVFHQSVLLVSVLVERRRRRISPPKTDLAVDLLTTVISADLIALLLLFAALVWQGGDLRELLPFCFLPVMGFYGVHLFGSCVRDALVPQPASTDSPTTGAAPQRASASLSGPEMPGLQLYATAATAWLAWGAIGWPQDWLGVFGIALISILVGRCVARLAVRRRQGKSGNNTEP